IDIPTAYPPEHYEDTLGEVLAKNGLQQLRIAETEKYAHVTFFFNGGVEEPNAGEDRILIPSPKVATYDLQPEMSAPQVTEALLKALEEDKYDVVILNFANPDMVGHTGIMEAAVKAMETVDACAGKIVDKIQSLDGVICITADHGNLEKMQNDDGTPCTAHTTNKVPFIVISKEKYKLHEGRLADIAPTLLQFLKISQPKAMTGKSLIEK
ncbi:MAG: alkaline phosphatase family protein, partial [Succiniclasticum sp.]